VGDWDFFVNEFDVKRVVEVSGTSTLLEAIDRRSERFVLIELFPRFAVAHDAQRFLLELQQVAALRSPHVMRVVSSGARPDGTCYVVSEPPRGESLTSLLSRRGPLPLTQIVELMLQACDALTEAHAASVVHRSLSPECLFASLDDEGAYALEIREFGTRLAARQSSDGLMLGLPHFIAPEQFIQASSADPLTDIWALGATMYELSSGRRPFEQAPPELGLALLTKHPVPLGQLRPELPAPFCSAVMRCLERAPEGRPNNPEALAEVIAPFGATRSNGVASTVRGVLEAGATRLRSSKDAVRHLMRARRP
jgi:eukaryotic-like serine/threonine-protein kinase